MMVYLMLSHRAIRLITGECCGKALVHLSAVRLKASNYVGKIGELKMSAEHRKSNVLDYGLKCGNLGVHRQLIIEVVGIW